MSNAGEKLSVEPVRKFKDLKAITKLLDGNLRNQLLWLIGINNGIRAADIVRIKIKQVEHLKPGEFINIIETKTGKENIIVINKTVHKAIRRYLTERYKKHEGTTSDEYLFQSRKGKDHIESRYVGRLIKDWTSQINLQGRYGAHTLRKTWGYHQRMNFGVGFEILCKRFNHSSPAVTMTYLGIQSKEVYDALMNEIG